MGKLNYKASEFDSAVRKVRADYADVTGVDATAADVLEGKIIMNANKELITGTLKNAEVTPNALILGSVVGDNESDYPVEATPSVNVNQEGYIDSISDGTTITKYIKTEEKTCTPRDYEQEINATSGRLMKSVTVQAADVPPVIEKMYISRFKLTAPTTSTGSSTKAYMANGNTHNNVYCSAEAAQSGTAKVYLYRLGSTLSDSTYIDFVDVNTKKVPSTTIVLSAGDSVTSTGNTFAPAGILTFTTEGRITFKHTAAFYVATGNSLFLLWINGYYYIPCVDYKYFSHNYTGVGSYVSTSTTYMKGGSISRVTGSTAVNFYKPKTLFANMTNIYFYAYYYRSNDYELIRMTFNYGTYEGYFVEDDE